jgi:hypothetical protein
MANIRIDGKGYDPARLSEPARVQRNNLQIADQEIARLKQQLAIAETARQAYARALQAELAASPCDAQKLV